MNVLKRWLYRWRHVWSRRGAERELEDEMRFHLEMEARDRLASGMSAAEAKRRAKLDFGGTDRYQEAVRDVRGLRWFDDARGDARLAVRTLVRERGFALTVIAILALAIGSNAAVFGIADRVLVRSLPYADADALMMLWQGLPGGRQWVSAPDAEDWSDRLRTFSGVAAFTPERLNVAGRLGAETVTSAAVDGRFFAVLGVPPVRGRTIGADEAGPGGAPVLVLSEALWRRRFGADPEIVGSTVSLEGSAATVIGIMPGDFAFPSGAEMWTPLRAFSQDWHSRRGIDWLQVIARVRPDASAELVTSDLEAVSAQLAAAYPETNAEDRIDAVPLREELYGDLRLPVLVLMGAVLLILLMACASVAGLLLARASVRGPETALRLALGSGRSRLVRGFLTESAVIAVAGGILGVLVARFGGRVLLQLAPIPEAVAPQTVFDARVLALAALTTLLTTILFGLAPAFIGSRRKLNETIRATGGVRHNAGLLFRRSLVTGQIAIAVILVTGGLLFARSLGHLLSQDAGFDADRTTTARVALTEANYPEDHHRIAFFSRLLEQVAIAPGIETAAIANDLPLAGSGITFSFEIENAPPISDQDAPLAGLRVVSPRYFGSMGIPIVQGRDFDSRDSPDGPMTVIVDSTLVARHLADRDPVGTRLRVAGDWRTIVGVVGPVRHSALDAAPTPTTYLPVTQRTAGSAFVIVRGARTTPDPATIVNAVRAIDTAQPVFALRDMSDYVNRAAAQPRFLAFIVGAFATAALLIATLGVYGIVSFNVTRRAREFGIRLAIGARPAAIVRNAVRDGVLLLAVGIPVGALGALALARFIEGTLFGIRSDDPVTLALVLLLLSVAILVASWLPARRAAGVDPMQVLRPE